MDNEVVNKVVDKRTLAPEALENLRKTVIELFANGLFHEVGIREIASKAKVSPQTIYKYFGNKDELIFACIEPDLKENACCTRKCSCC